MTITSNLRFLYIFGESGLLCAAAAGMNVGSFGGSREGLFGLCCGSPANVAAASRLLLSLLIPTSRVAGYYDELSEGQRSLLPK